MTEILPTASTPDASKVLTPSQELSENTGIPVDQISPDMLEKYELAKSINANLDLLTVKSERDLTKKIAILHEILEKNDGDETGVENATQAAAEAVASVQEDVVAAIEDTPNAVSDWAAQKASEKVQEKLNGLPFGIGEKLSGISGTIGDFIKQIFTALTGAIGGLGFTKWLKDKFGWGVEVPAAPKTDDPAPENVAPTTPLISESEIAPDTITENILPSSFTIGARLLIELNNEMGELKSQDPKSTYIALQYMSYNEIMSLSGDMPPEGFYNSEEESEKKKALYQHIISSLKSKITQDILRISLHNEALKNILCPYGVLNSKLFILFGKNETAGKERIEEILSLIENGNFDWKKLSFQELSMLYAHSIPALRIPAIAGVKEMGVELQTLFFGDGGTLENGQDIAESFLPKELILGIGTLGNSITYPDALAFEKEAEQKSQIFKNIPEEKRESCETAFSALMKFKGKIQEESFFRHPKLGLTIEQQKMFQEKSSLAHVIMLYSILGGNSDLSSVSILSFPPLIYCISKIVGRGDETSAMESGVYLGGYMTHMLMDNTQSPFSDDELEILKIYAYKLGDVILMSHVRSVAGLLGVSEGITGLSMTELSLGTLVGGGLMRGAGSLMLKNSLKAGNVSLLGLSLKRLGNIGLLAGVALGGISWYGEFKSNGFSQALKKADESGNIENILAVLKQQKDSIQEITTTNGSKIMVYAFPGDTPLYIIDGKIYSIKTGDKNFIDRLKDNQGVGDVLSTSWDLLISSFVESTGEKSSIDYKVQNINGDIVVFGEGENTLSIPLSELLTFDVNEKTVIGQDIIRQFTEGEKSLAPFGFNLGNEGEKGFILQKIGTDSIMFLSEIGEVGDLFESQAE